MTLHGKLTRVDLGTGGWVLETKEGEKIALFGDVPASLADCRVVVQGKEIEGSSFMMTGDKMVEVSTIKAE
jgi:hypothetical protein